MIRVPRPDRPSVRIRSVAGVAVFDVHHGGRRITWPTWAIAIAHANRLATEDRLIVLPRRTA